MSFGFFVEMDNTVEGLVPVHTLSNDFYDYDEDTMTLKGQTHGKVFQMGMQYVLFVRMFKGKRTSYI